MKRSEKSPGCDHGPRLTGEEFDRRIVDLQSRLPPAPSKEQAREARRRQLDLAIDHRLGTRFPAARRDELWAVQQRIRTRPVRTTLRYLLRRLLPGGVARGADRTARLVVDEYAKVLSPAELEAFFGPDEVRNPSLPVDLDEIDGK